MDLLMEKIDKSLDDFSTLALAGAKQFETAYWRGFVDGIKRAMAIAEELQSEESKGTDNVHQHGTR